MNTRAPHEIAMMQDNDDCISWASAESNNDIIPQILVGTCTSSSATTNTTLVAPGTMAKVDGYLWNGPSFLDSRSLGDSFSSINSDLSIATSNTTASSSSFGRRGGDDPTSMTKRKLSATFRPTNYSVVFGRGPECFNATGNRRLRVTARLFLPEYAQANSRVEKSSIVSKLVSLVRESSPEGAFVRYDGGCWWEVSDSVAREKVGAQLRDLLHTKYRSSTKSKLEKRKQARKEARKVGGNQQYTATTTATNPFATTTSPSGISRPITTIDFAGTGSATENEALHEPISLSEDIDPAILTRMSSLLHSCCSDLDENNNDEIPYSL